MEVRRATVLGAGSWGTALAIQLQRRGAEVRVWGRDADALAQYARDGANSRYLPEAPTTGLTWEPDGPRALGGTDLVVHAIPSHALRATLRQLATHVPERAVHLIAVKGIETEGLAPMAAVVAEECPGAAVAVLGGPSFAAEVAKGLPTAVVAAAADSNTAGIVQAALSTEAFRVYTSSDMIGVELGGTAKNVIALATGVADGAGLGLNTRAALITRGLVEISRLGAELGADPTTMMGLAGLGDLVLTCTGGLSRNRRVGVALGEGKALDAILQEMGMVAEGVRNTEAIHRLSLEHDVEMPIVATMQSILYEGLGIPDAVRRLMSRTLKDERG